MSGLSWGGAVFAGYDASLLRDDHRGAKAHDLLVDCYDQNVVAHEDGLGKQDSHELVVRVLVQVRELVLNSYVMIINRFVK